MRIIGMISGTSADGIDAALVELDGAPPSLKIKLIKHITYDYDPALQAEIFACFRPETGTVDRLTRLNTALGEAFAQAALTVIKAADTTPDQVDLIGSHGQTIWYDAPANGTDGAVLTLGEPAIIAARTGITTISHFRENDLAVGGYGAPLVSYMDWLLFRHPSLTRATQNIGGIGNVTYLPPLTSAASPLTFDTGPGNMLMDYCTSRATDGAQGFDRDGLIAAKGKVNEAWLTELMQEPYLHQAPPKATGRELFGAQLGVTLWDKGISLGMSGADIVATMTAFTAESIAAAYRDFLPTSVDEVYVAGGGAKNPTLMRMLQDRTERITTVKPHDDLGVPSTAKECMLFALLAYETWHNRTGALPALTKARQAAVLGSITYGRLTK
ncbi:MAG: anhydro-N-acetylmuramic acid kinase [Anaerolineae bacterium]|nr:anhydro-N-acetylmuramic acid kinase [Anaerolineae bacterium]